MQQKRPAVVSVNEITFYKQTEQTWPPKESVISPTQEIGDINKVQKGVYLIDSDFLHTGAAGSCPV